MLLGIFFAGASDNLQLGIQATRSENDVEVGRVGGSGSDQPARPLDMRFAQRLFLGRVPTTTTPSLLTPTSIASLFPTMTNRTRPPANLPPATPSQPSSPTIM